MSQENRPSSSSDDIVKGDDDVEYSESENVGEPSEDLKNTADLNEESEEQHNRNKETVESSETGAVPKSFTKENVGVEHETTICENLSSASHSETIDNDDCLMWNYAYITQQMDTLNDRYDDLQEELKELNEKISLLSEQLTELQEVLKMEVAKKNILNCRVKELEERKSENEDMIRTLIAFLLPFSKQHKMINEETIIAFLMVMIAENLLSTHNSDDIVKDKDNVIEQPEAENEGEPPELMSPDLSEGYEEQHKEAIGKDGNSETDDGLKSPTKEIVEEKEAKSCEDRPSTNSEVSSGSELEFMYNDDYSESEKLCNLIKRVEVWTDEVRAEEKELEKETENLKEFEGLVQELLVSLENCVESQILLEDQITELEEQNGAYEEMIRILIDFVLPC